MARAAPKQLTEARMDSVAEWTAQGGSVTAWGEAAGLSQTQADRIWQRVRKPLGWQAR